MQIEEDEKKSLNEGNYANKTTIKPFDEPKSKQWTGVTNLSQDSSNRALLTESTTKITTEGNNKRSRSVCSFSSPERPEIEIIRYFNKVTHSHYRSVRRR